VKIKRIYMWEERTFSALYKQFVRPFKTKIDVLKLQGLYIYHYRFIIIIIIIIIKGLSTYKTDVFDSVQYVMLSDLYLHRPEVKNFIEQIAVTISITANTLIDTLGREGEVAWNMWGSRRFLKEFGAFSSRTEAGSHLLQPAQFYHSLDQAKLDSLTSYYHNSYIKIKDPKVIEKYEVEYNQFIPQKGPTLVGTLPAYCQAPSQEEDEKMQKWIQKEINIRCHPTRLWVICDETRTYDAFLPCAQELINMLADDYASSKNWCNFKSPLADIEPLVKVDPKASKAFQKPKISGEGNDIRLCFLYTVYSDEAYVKRLFKHMYSPKHYYLLHVDPTGSSDEFKKAMETFASQYDNVFISMDIPIVYGASTATIILSRSMAWFLKYASGWDYMVCITGSDYPLVPLNVLEIMLKSQNPPMPFVMAWTPGTSTHLFRLTKHVPAFEYDPLLYLSLKAVTDERGQILGAVPMEYRSTNFGPPVLCRDRKNFYHLDNRRNKSTERHDTQWLFPRDKIPQRGRAYPDEDEMGAYPSFDGVFRVWKKSDPATTGIYDRESVEYIVRSEEGKKYWHFFKHMLLGSEEHYYVSLLYNWPRTKRFVQSVTAQSVWNTWELGLWESAAGFQTHTHFLTTKEWDILKGFSKRGMIFARKFSTKKTPELLDMIDSYILNNKSTDAGSHWPGFFYVDTWTYGKSWVSWFRNNQTLQEDSKRWKRWSQQQGFYYPRHREGNPVQNQKNLGKGKKQLASALAVNEKTQMTIKKKNNKVNLRGRDSLEEITR